MSKGFFEGILHDILLAGAVEASRDKSGKPDPYKAAGIAMGFGHTSLEDQMRLATMLGSEGAFEGNDSADIFATSGQLLEQQAFEVESDWRNTDIGLAYDLYPEDFDDEDEFLAAIEAAEAGAIFSIDDSCAEEYDTEITFSIIPDDAERFERETSVKRYLYEKYSKAYPNIFTKDYLDQSFYDMGMRASKKASSVELPYIMLSDIVSHCNVQGLGVFYLLVDGKTKKCVEVCRKYLPKIVSIIEGLKFDEVDLEALFAFVQSKLVLEMNELRAAHRILKIISEKHPEYVQDELITSFCTETVDLLTDGTIKAPFDSKIRYLSLCAEVVKDLSTKKCYKKAIERIYAENEAQQLIYKFRPNDKKALMFWDVGDDFMDDFIFSLLTSKDKGVVCHTFSVLHNDFSLSERQLKWVHQGLEHLQMYAADGYGDEEVYSNYCNDPVFKKTVLEVNKHLGRLLGHLLAMSISKQDISSYRDLMRQYDKQIRFTDKKRDFIKFLNQELECVYIDPFCDSAEKFAEYMDIAKDLRMIVSDPIGRAYGANVSRLCDDIERDYSKFVEANKKISIEEQKHNELLKRIMSLIKKMDEGMMWKSKAITKDSLRVLFKFPDGKNGDVSMYLASKCGTLTQVDAITRCVTIPMSNRDYIPLLVRPFDNTDSLNSGARSYLSREHNFYRLLEAVSELESNQKRVAHEHLLELDVPEDIWERIRATEQSYASSLTKQREDIYQALAKAGLLSAKWVSEYQVFTIVSSLYDDSIYQYRAEWLGSQSIDIFVPSINVGIEYQGVQHYRSVELFGGDEGLRERKKLDARKKRLCKENGIKLVEIKYTDEITVDFVKEKIQAVL